LKTSKKIYRIYTLCIAFTLYASFNAIAQQFIVVESQPGDTIAQYERLGEFEAKFLFGSVLPHYSYMNYLSETFQKGIALHYTMRSKRETLYDEKWKYPTYGVGMRHITMGNSEKLGNLSMLYAIFNGRFFRRYPLVNYQINTGLAYAHKNMRKSLYNTAVSSPLSFFAAINCGVEYYSRIIWGSSIRFGIELEHISNGKTTTPNLGFNSLLLTASYRHRFPCGLKPGIVDYDSYSPPETNHHRINLTAAGFFKTDDFVTEKKYFTSVFFAEYEWLSRAYWWGLQAGGDYFYDHSIAALKPKPTTWSEHKRLMDAGVHAGAFIKYSHVVLLLQMGRYIGSTTQSADFFTRVGLRYEWQRLFANVSMRAHGATAQSVEMGVGYKIRLSPLNPPQGDLKKQ